MAVTSAALLGSFYNAFLETLVYNYVKVDMLTHDYFSEKRWCLWELPEVWVEQLMWELSVVLA